MPARSQMRIRRDINRLKETVDRHGASQPALAAIQQKVDSAAHLVNERWQAYQQAVVKADKERDERDVAIVRVRKWLQRWRPVVLLTVPGAAPNLRALPPGGATPDDVIRVADDLRVFVDTNPAAAPFKDAALEDLGTGVEDARKETVEAVAARPAEAGTREAFGEATLTANTVLVRGTEVVRAIFGPTSPEYKMFIARASQADEEAEDAEAETGEGR